MSGTRMDRLQNQVTGSILLNVIENTAKLNKKTTSGSSISNEDLKVLQTKVNQMSSTVAQASTKADTAQSTAETASTKADAAKSTAETASTKADAAKSTAETASANASAAKSTAETASANASAAKSTAETASTKADAAQSTAETASSKAQEALTGLQTIQTSAVIKNPDGGAAQTINGELKASDFKSGDVSLVGLSNNVVLKNPSAAQTINGDITLTGNLTTGNLTTENLTIPLITSDQSNLNLGDGSKTVKLLGDTIIGKDDKETFTQLTVNGGIIAYGDVSVQKADPDAPTDPWFSSKVIVTQEIHHTSDTGGTLITLSKTGVTIGKSDDQMTQRTLQVHGNTTIGSSTDSADLTVNGNMTIASGGGETSMLTSENIVTEFISRTSDPDIPLITLDASGVNLGALSGSTTVRMHGGTIIGTTDKNANLTVTGSINLGRLNVSYDPIGGVITFHDSTSGKTATITLN